MSDNSDYNPIGWVSTKLGNIIQLEYGKGLTEKSRDTNGGIPVYGSNGIVGYHSKALVNGPCIIVGRKGAAGRIHLSNSDCWPIDTTYFIHTSNELDIHFIYYLLDHLKLNTLDKSTAIPGLNRDDAYSMSILLPPLAEQQRIVSKIEELFTQLDVGVEALKKAKEQLKKYQLSVLKIAFEYEDKKWEVSCIGDTCEIISGYAFKSEDFCENGIPVIKIANIGYGEYISEKNEYLPQEFKERYKKFVVKPDTILLALTRPITNNTVKVCRYPPLEKHGLLNQRVAMVFPKIEIDDEYLYCYMQSPVFKTQVEKSTSETLQPNLSPIQLTKLVIPLPPLKEQLDTVQEIERQLSIIKMLELYIDTNISHAKTLRQSILNQAFSGTLVPQDPNDEPAEKLLERIRAERNHAGDSQGGKAKKGAKQATLA